VPHLVAYCFIECVAEAATGNVRDGRPAVRDSGSERSDAENEAGSLRRLRKMESQPAWFASPQPWPRVKRLPLFGPDGLFPTIWHPT